MAPGLAASRRFYRVWTLRALCEHTPTAGAAQIWQPDLPSVLRLGGGYGLTALRQQGARPVVAVVEGIDGRVGIVPL